MKKTKQRLLRRREDVDASRDTTPSVHRPELIVLDVSEREQAADVMTFLANQEGSTRGGPVLPTVYELTLVPGPDEVQ